MTQRRQHAAEFRMGFLLLFCALAMAGFAQAEENAAGSGHHRGHEGDRRGEGQHGDRHSARHGRGLSLAAQYAGELGLEPEDQAKIAEIVASSGARNESLREALDRTRKEMKALMREAHRPDKSAVMAKADDIAVAEAAIHKNRLAAILQIRAVLSPEQRQELMRLADEKRSHRDRRGKSKHHRKACRADIREHCVDASRMSKSGDASNTSAATELNRGQDLLVCLEANWVSLSEDCRASFHADFESARGAGGGEIEASTRP